MYKLNEGTESGLNKITPKVLKSLKALGLYSTNITAGAEVEMLLDMYIDNTKLKQLCETIFTNTEKLDYDNLDLAEFMRGYESFFGQLKPNKT